MSQASVEIVRAFYEAWNAGDMGTVREFYARDAIMCPPEGWPEQGPFVGQDAVMREWEQLRSTWSADAVEPIGDFIDSADRVVVRHIWHGAGHGPEMNLEITNVVTVRNGRIVYQEFFWDHAEALATLRRSE